MRVSSLGNVFDMVMRPEVHGDGECTKTIICILNLVLKT